MPVGGKSVNDPYLLRDGIVASADVLMYNFTAQRTKVSSALVGGQTTLVILAMGQSTIANYDDTLYTPASSLVHNFNICGGNIYQAKDPLLGCTGWVGGCWLGRLGDKLISGGVCQRVILVPIAVGATEVARWGTGGDLNHRIIVAKNRLAAAGLTPDCAIWHQGERDQTIGTNQATYAAGLAGVISTTRALYPNVPLFINQVSVTNYTAYSPVTAAQIAAVDHANKVWAGANSDSLLGANRQSDGTHWTATGSDAIAALMVSALHAYGAPF
jgi:hypothetical protein